MTERMKVGFNKFVAHLNRYFQEYVELVPATLLFIFGVLTALPKEWLPGGSSVYVSNVVKLIFGIIMLVPGVRLLWLRIRNPITVYTFLKIKERTRGLFYVTISFIYLGVLSAIATLYPPRWLLFLALGFISLLCYLRISKRG